MLGPLLQKDVAALKRIYRDKQLASRKYLNTELKWCYIHKALIEPHFLYSSSVFDGLSQRLSDKLQKLKNRAARVITKLSYDTSSSLLFDILGWDNLSTNRKKQKAIIMYKTIHKLTPVDLQEIFTCQNTMI